MLVRPAPAFALILLATCLVPTATARAQTPAEAVRSEAPPATNEPDATLTTLGATGCTEGVAAVLVRADAPTPYATLPEAAAALTDGDGLWVCPGVVGLDEPLHLADLTGVTLAGRDALVVASENTAVIAAERMTDLHLDGLGFMHALRWDECSADVVVVRDSTSVSVTNCRFDGSGIVGLALRGVTGAEVRGNFVTNCFTGMEATGSTDVTLLGNRLVYNETHLGGDLDATAEAVDNDFGPLGRGPAEGALPAPPAPAAASWVDWDTLLAAHTTYPIRDWNGGRYLVLHYDNGAPSDVSMPPCFDEPDGAPCIEPIPYTGDATTWLPEAQRSTIQVIGPPGPCSPTVGDVVVLDTTGCEPSATVAARIDGCGDDLAPVAFAGPPLPALTWQAREDLAFPFDEESVTDPTLRDWVSRSLASSVVGSWRIPSMTERGRIASWRARLAHESLTSFMAGFQVEYSECNVVDESWRETWLRVNDVAHAVELPGWSSWVPWRGALGFDGYIVGIVGQGATEVVLTTRAADGSLRAAVEQPYWSDNGECYSPELPGEFEYPCGP